MARKEDRGSEAIEVSESPKPESGQLKIRWDSANMRSAYANVFNVAGTREEVVILFGMNQAWHSGQKEVKVQLTDRVVLSPFAAKRLVLLLGNVVRDYEKKYGALDAEARRQGESTLG